MRDRPIEYHLRAIDRIVKAARAADKAAMLDSAIAHLQAHKAAYEVTLAEGNFPTTIADAAHRAGFRIEVCGRGIWANMHHSVKSRYKGEVMRINDEDVYADGIQVAALIARYQRIKPGWNITPEQRAAKEDAEFDFNAIYAGKGTRPRAGDNP